MADVTIVSNDFPGMLAHCAGGNSSDWVEMDGPESGSGLDYWYRNVKTDEEAARCVAGLFPQEKIFEVMGYIEKRMAQLPGMDNLDCCTLWATKVQPMLPPETRAKTIPTAAAA